MTDAENTHNPQRIGPTPDGEATSMILTGAPHDDIGAYVLDALTADELRAFEEHLTSCAACQAEVVALRSSLQFLPLLASDPQTAQELDQLLAIDVTDLRPATDLRDRIREAVSAEATPPVAEPTRAATRRTDSTPVQRRMQAAEPASPLPTDRPPGRIRPGARERKPTTPAEILRFPTRFNWSTLAAVFLAFLATGAILWALALQSRLDDRGREIEALEARVMEQGAEIADLQTSSSNAVAWTLRPGADVAAELAGASGNLFYSKNEQLVTLVVEGLPPLPEGEVYQLWYIGGPGGPAPRPSETFVVESDAQGMLRITGVPQDFTQVAISREPAGGSQQPTTVLMEGLLSARG